MNDQFDAYDESVQPLYFMDGESLFAEPMHHTEFLVPGILPQGTHLLCGAPKMGKSWLALWLAVQLTGGGEVWGEKIEPCGVLYLCLEDTPNRVKERMHQLADEISPNLHISTECLTMGEGLQDQLHRYLRMFPETKLIIIDTLQKVRGVTSDSNVYRADYMDISALKRLGDSLHVTILLVHHLRKMPDTADPFNMISGSNGLSGAVDGMFLLYKDKRTENTARFLMTGRDIETQEFQLAFENCRWKLISRDTPQPAPKAIPPALHAVVRFMQEKDTWVGKASQLAEQLKPLGISVLPHHLTKHIAHYSDWLDQHGIGYRTARDHTGRYLGLVRYDAPDGTVGTADGECPQGREETSLGTGGNDCAGRVPEDAPDGTVGTVDTADGECPRGRVPEDAPDDECPRENNTVSEENTPVETAQHTEICHKSLNNIPLNSDDYSLETQEIVNWQPNPMPTDEDAPPEVWAQGSTSDFFTAEDDLFD